jgi:uncharacterized NAD(P)/FAD-binding protein YdhS
MVDVLLSLIDQGHRGSITVLSRRGKLPRPHTAPRSWTLSEAPSEVTVMGLLRWVRSEVDRAAAVGVEWQNVMDAAKGNVQTWWRALSISERQRFLRHVRPFWEVHRHRMPQEAFHRLEQLQRSGRLRLVAASVERVRVSGRELQLDLRHRAGGAQATVNADHVINCTGPQTDTRRMEQPLLRDLLQKGFATWDDLHLGLRTTAQGALVNASGAAAGGLYAIGPLCKATLWECTAVPEIREGRNGAPHRARSVRPAGAGRCVTGPR